MSSTTVRVTEHTQTLLRELAAATGEPLKKVLERAVEAYRREQFYAELNAAYERLQSRPGRLGGGARRTGGVGRDARRWAR